MITLQKRYLVLSDFDGTLFDTFSPSPNGIDVRKAYALALRDLFGDKAGEWFIGNPDLSMSTPTEIVSQAILKFGFLPDNISDLRVLTNYLVNFKLDYLLSEIGLTGKHGKIWPQPLEGAVGFIRTIGQLKQESVPIDFGIVSSGHEKFIRRTLDLWELPQPDILITDDDIRNRIYPSEASRKFKPGTLPLALAHQEWIRPEKQNGASFVDLARETKGRVMYIGDSVEKDFGMARAGNVLFCLVPDISWETITNGLKNKRSLFDGRPISEIFGEKVPILETLNHRSGGGKKGYEK